MPERDANQLAADVRQRPINHNKGFMYGIRPAELDELVGLVGTLQQERDEAREMVEWDASSARRAVAAEAALATTRQALTDIELATHAGVALNHIGWVARRALAATEEPA